MNSPVPGTGSIALDSQDQVRFVAALVYARCKHFVNVFIWLGDEKVLSIPAHSRATNGSIGVG